jgi:sulfate permease, SulP family
LRAFGGLSIRPAAASARPAALLPWLRGYGRDKLLRDAAAACVVATLLVPQSMSYALLMGVSPVYGLYSSVAPLAAHGLVSASSCTMVGIVAPMALTALSVATQVAPPGTAQFSAEFARVHVKLAFAAGLVALAVSALRLSWLAKHISGAVIAGFTYGAACLIIASQVSDLLGVSYSPPESLFGPLVARALQNAGGANRVAAVIGASNLLILLCAKSVKVGGAQLPKLTPLPLIVMAAMMAVSYAADLKGRFGVAIVGSIPGALPTLSIPFDSAAEFAVFLPYAAVLAAVAFVQQASINSVFMAKKNERLDQQRELFAFALSNTLGGLTQSVVSSASFSRSAVAFDAGATTPMTSLLSAALMAVAIVALAPALAYIPKATLAAVVTSSVQSLLAPDAWLAHWRRGKLGDFFVMLFTLAMILWLDVLYGLVAGIGVSLLLRAFAPRGDEESEASERDSV